MSRYLLPVTTIMLVLGVAWRLITIVIRPEVGFILPQPQVAHLGCDNCADSFESTLKQLGVTTDRTRHEDHTDVRYQCPRWRVAIVDTHERVDDWKRWLHDKGFATSH